MNDVRIKPILDAQLAEKVMQASREDGHLIFQPTHLAEKNGQIIGAFNLNRLPISVFWMDSKKAQVRDSLVSIQVGENIARARGDSILLLLTKPESPFNSLIGRLGYSQLDTMNLNYKLLQ